MRGPGAARSYVRRVCAALGLTAIVLAGGCITHEGVLRTRVASQFGCSEDTVDVRPLGGNSYQAGCGDESSTYVCVGPNGTACGSPAAVTCVLESSRGGDSAAAQTPAPRAEAATPDRPTVPRHEPRPQEVAEFEFGSTRADAAVVCERGGGTMGESTDQGPFRVSECSRVPVTIANVAGPVHLAFCDGALCAIRLTIDGGDGSDASWLTAVRALGRAIGTRYGPLRAADMPSGCDAEIRAGSLARVRTGECTFRGTVLVVGGDVQLSLSGSGGTIRGALQYRTSEMLRALRARQRDADMVGAEHL